MHCLASPMVIIFSPAAAPVLPTATLCSPFAQTLALLRAVMRAAQPNLAPLCGKGQLPCGGMCNLIIHSSFHVFFPPLLLPLSFSTSSFLHLPPSFVLSCSMEGSMPKLPEIIALKKKYKVCTQHVMPVVHNCHLFLFLFVFCLLQ